MKMEETESGLMAVSSTTSSEDSGFDNGFLSDSSSSSVSLDCYQQICVLGEAKKPKGHSKYSRHKCLLNSYNISGKSIETISPRTFQYLSNCVRKLNLSNNNIKSLPETICQLRNLEELNISHNELRTVPESWKVLQNLKTLDISYNFLCGPPECLDLGMNSLIHIDLSRNKISKLEKPLCCLPSLKCLNLSRNCLDSLPLWLFSDQCRSLVELDVSFNFCFDNSILKSKLPLLKHHRTSALKTLQKLNVSNTGSNFGMLSDISCFESLQCVQMGNFPGPDSISNHFWDISVMLFFNPGGIIELRMPRVGLSGLPEDFCRLENLEVLDLSDNPLDWLPDSFGTLKSLRELYMSSCSLSYLPDNFNQLRNLKKLIVDNNKLTDVSSALTELASLEWLDLYNNCLDEFPLTHGQLLTLHMVDVAGNYVNLEEALDFKVEGESLLDVYYQQQSRLREADSRNQPREDGHKVYSGPSTWDSDESLHKRYSRSESVVSLLDADQQQEAFVADEEENWDDDRSTGEDYFDPNGVMRYSLPPGKYKFGWRPPVRHRECVVPIALLLSGFVYVPGKAHVKTTRTRHKKLSQEPNVEGQFDDTEVDDTSARQKADTLWDLLKEKRTFERNSRGPIVRPCRLCSVYEDCWHSYVWLRF